MTTIQKCFRKAGILDSDFAVVRRVDDSDPFEDLDDDPHTEELQTLIQEVHPAAARCSVEEFIGTDNDIPICMDAFSFGDNWEEEFFNQVACSSEDITTSVNEDIEQEEEVEEEVIIQPAIVTFKEAMQQLEEVSRFLDDNGCTKEAGDAYKLLDSITRLCFTSEKTKQTHITDFFK